MIIETNGKKIIIGKNVPASPMPQRPREETRDELMYKICKMIEEGGFNPVSQIVGYIISEDPTHISNYKNARTLMTRIDRDELLEAIVKAYLDSLDSRLGSGHGDAQDHD